MKPRTPTNDPAPDGAPPAPGAPVARGVLVADIADFVREMNRFLAPRRPLVP